MVLGWVLVLAAILMGGSVMMFVNAPSIMIVIGGTIAATLISQPMARVLGSFTIGMNAIFDKTSSVEETTTKLQIFAQIVRKNDLLALENENVEDEFMARAVRLAVDGVPVETIRQTLTDEMYSLKTRHEGAQDSFKFMGTIAPAMGMIGTLIGLVQMLQALDDPASIGPAMAVAMLTTLYGALLANLVFLPMAYKLADRTRVEALNMTLIIEGIESIVKGENAMITKEKLQAFLSPLERGDGQGD